jgi:hypothetical protein
MRASSFETRPSGAPQDEGKPLILVVRSLAKRGVSNHEGHEEYLVRT